MREVSWPYGWGRVDYSYSNRKQWLNLPFAISEYERRIGQARDVMDRLDLGAIIVHGLKGGDRATIRYFTNFEDYYGGDTFFIIPRDGDVALATNAVMHGEPMHSGVQECWVEDIRAAPHPRTVDVPTTTVYEHILDILHERNLPDARIGFAGKYAQSPIETLRPHLPKATIVPASEQISEVMARKSDAEVQHMRKVAKMSDAGMGALIDAAVPGSSEHDLAAAAMYAMFKEGAEDSAFPLSACSGPRAGFKHATPRNRVLSGGEICFTDLGGQLEGYCSDTARGTVVGGTPSPEQRRFLEAQIRIVEESLAIVRPGVTIGAIADVAADVARGFGYEKYFYFRGHGIGAHTHIPPSFVPGSEVRLEENMTFAYEPMLVKEDMGTACVEDIYLVTQSGYERLSNLPMKLWD